MADEVGAELIGDIEMAAPITKSSQLMLAKEWLSKQRSSMKPWREFVSTSRFSKPKSIAEVGRRVVKNLEEYQSNYVLIAVLISFYCVVTNPLLLIAISIGGGGCWYLTYRNEGKKIKILGREFSVMEQYGLIGVLSLPLLFLASATSTVFWIIGASFFVITLHSAFLGASPTPDPNAFELEMEPV